MIARFWWWLTKPWRQPRTIGIEVRRVEGKELQVTLVRENGPNLTAALYDVPAGDRWLP